MAILPIQQLTVLTTHLIYVFRLGNNSHLIDSEQNSPDSSNNFQIPLIADLGWGSTEQILKKVFNTDCGERQLNWRSLVRRPSLNPFPHKNIAFAIE